MNPGLVSKQHLPKRETKIEWHVEYSDLHGNWIWTTHRAEHLARVEAKHLNTGPKARFYVSVVEVTTTRTTILATTRADSL